MATSKSRLFMLLALLLLTLSNKVKGQSGQISKELKRFSSIDDDRELINHMNYVGLLYQAKNVDSCIYYGLKAKSLAIKHKYAKGELDADNLIGIALHLKGLSKESLERFSDVLKRYRQQGDTENVVQVLMNMAIGYSYLTDTAQSKSYYQQAMSEGSKLKKDSIMSLVYVNYCISTESLSGDSVRYYLDKSQNIAKKYKNLWVKVLAMQIWANWLVESDREKALPLIMETLEDARDLKLEFLEVNSLLLLGNYYKNDANKALAYYQQAYDLQIALGSTNILIPTINAMLTAAKLTGKSASIEHAHELLANAIALENKNLKNFIGDYVKYNSIEANNKLLEINNHNQGSKIWLLIAMLSICTLLAGFVYKQYRGASRLNQKISEQNDSLQIALTALEESQKENTRMMKIVAHDLRNPIGAIKMASSLLLSNVNDPDNIHKLTGMISQSADKSLELVSDLLSAHTKLDEIKKDPIDLPVMLHYCAELLKHKAIAKEQHIELNTLPIEFPGSRERLWRVFSNLIANAIKFSPIGATIRVNIEMNGPNVRIAVIDTGIGIPEEMKIKVFDMFTEAKRPGTSGEQSFGLGLAISKQIVEAHGGNIWFESVLGTGTTFFVELPHNNSANQS